MKTDHERYQEIKNQIDLGQAIIIREKLLGNENKVQLIVRMILEELIIMWWEYSNGEWNSIPMDWLALDMNEIKALQSFLIKYN